MLLLCLLIFCCRIIDVSLGTIRTIVTVKGITWLASLIGFVEVFIWFVVVQQALTGADGSIYVALSYAGGYATGTLIGSLVAKKLIPTKLEVQIITSNKNETLIEILKNNGFAMTIVNAVGAHKKEEKYMIYIDISSKNLKLLKKLVLENDPQAFISINEASSFIGGYFTKKK